MSFKCDDCDGSSASDDGDNSYFYDIKMESYDLVKVENLKLFFS